MRSARLQFLSASMEEQADLRGQVQAHSWSCRARSDKCLRRGSARSDGGEGGLSEDRKKAVSCTARQEGQRVEALARDGSFGVSQSRTNYLLSRY
jgi:hypothetical protein